MAQDVPQDASNLRLKMRDPLTFIRKRHFSYSPLLENDTTSSHQIGSMSITTHVKSKSEKLLY